MIKRLIFKILCLCLLPIQVMLIGNTCLAGLYFSERYDNARFKHDFNTNNDLIGNATSAVTLKLANDPTPSSGMFLDGTMIVVDPGFNRLIWNHYNPQSEKYGIRDLYGTIKYPRSIATDSVGNIYITDVYGYKIYKYRLLVNTTGHNLQHVMSFGEIGIGNGQFVDPFNIEVAESISRPTRIYVSDLSRHDIQMFDESGNFILKIGQVGSGDGQFNTPRGMAAAGNILYVADTGNGRIQKFNVTDVGYQFVSALYRGVDIPDKAVLTDVEFGSDGIYIVDEKFNKIYLYTLDFTYIRTYGGNPTDPFEDLKGISIVPPSGGLRWSIQAITVEKKRVQSFRLGMEALNVRAEPSYFHPLASESSFTTLKYTLTEHGFIQLLVRDSNNKTVRTLAVDQLRSMGHNQEVWDGKDDNGNYLPGGLYMFDLYTYDTNANGHAVKRVRKYSPITIHDPPVITITSTSPSAIYSGAGATVAFTLSKPAKTLKTEIIDQNNNVVQTNIGTGVQGPNQIYWYGRNQTGQNPPDGYYTIRIQAMDHQDYWGLPKSTQVGLANAPPQVSLNMPANDTFGLEASITGAVNGFLLYSYRLEYRREDLSQWNPIAVVNTSSDEVSGELAKWTTQVLLSSETSHYTLKLTAVNQAGVRSTEQTIYVLVDNIPPRLSSLSLNPQFISPIPAAAGSTQNASTITCQIDETNHFENKLEMIDKFSIRRNELSLDNNSNIQSRTWNGLDYSHAVIQDGLVTCRLVAMDAGGNVSAKETQLFIDTNRYPENIAVQSTLQITGHLEYNYKICWTPDSRKIAYAARQGNYYIYLANADGTGYQTIKEVGNHQISSPDIKPDGRRFLYHYIDLAVIGVDEFIQYGNYQRFVTHDGFYGRWSPDGAEIAYVRGDADHNYIHLMDAEGNSSVFLTPGYFPSWSPDGKYILYSTNQDLISGYQSDIYAFSVDDKTSTGPIVRNGIYPEYSPDGNLLIFLNAELNFSVLIRDGSIQPLIETAQSMRMATWSPDGEKLAYITRDGATYVATLDRQDRYANLTAILHVPQTGETDIRGSAADLNFGGYELSWATSSSAPAWNLLKSSNQQVKEGTLGEWDTSSLPPGEYWLKLHVWDKALNRKIIKRKLDISTLGPNLVFNVYAEPNVILPDVGGQDFTNIYYTLRGAVSAITLNVYNETGTQVRTLNPPQDPGGPYPLTLFAAWDGKDNNNVVVPTGAYTFKLQCQGGGQSILKQGTVLVAGGQSAAIITSPLMGGWSAKKVVFEGTAMGYEFDEYRLEVFGPGLPSMTLIAQSAFPVRQGILAEWNASHYGDCAAELTVKNKLGMENTTVVLFRIDSTPSESLLEAQTDFAMIDGKTYVGVGNQFAITSQDSGPYSVGLKETQYNIGGDWLIYSAPFTISTSGEHVIQYHALDLVDNQEETKSITVVVNDLTPVTSVSIGQPQYQPYETYFLSGSTEISLTATEVGATAVPVQETHWGIAEPQRIKFPGDEYQVGEYQVYTGPFNLSDYTGQGISLYTRSLDQTGNLEAWHQTGPLYVDVTGPETTLSWDGPDPVEDTQGNLFATTATMYLLTAQDAESGADYIEYQTLLELGGQDWNGYVPGDKVLLTTEGDHEIRYRAVDFVGNSESAKSYHVIIDNTRPQIDLGIEENGIYAAPFIPGIVIEDQHLRSSEITLDGQTYVAGTPISGLGEHNVFVMGLDWAGNSNEAQVSFILIESSPTPTPSLTSTPSPTASLTKTPTPSLTITLTRLNTCTETPTPTPSMTSTPTPKVYPIKPHQVLAYPNPGRTSMKFALRLAVNAQVKIEVYNISGERIAIIEEHKSAAPWGTFLEWKCGQAAPGIYICRITVREESGNLWSKTIKVAVIN